MAWTWVIAVPALLVLEEAVGAVEFACGEHATRAPEPSRLNPPRRRDLRVKEFMGPFRLATTSRGPPTILDRLERGSAPFSLKVWRRLPQEGPLSRIGIQVRDTLEA
jgi:hypothetical protein